MTRRRRKDDDPIADYVEWSNHRYDPGYYLGGNIPPFLRRLDRNPMHRRWGWIGIAISGLTGAGLFYSWWKQDLPGDSVLAEGALLVLMLWLGVASLRRARTASKDCGRRRKRP
jgi:hypothetical protein